MVEANLSVMELDVGVESLRSEKKGLIRLCSQKERGDERRNRRVNARETNTLDEQKRERDDSESRLSEERTIWLMMFSKLKRGRSAHTVTLKNGLRFLERNSSLRRIVKTLSTFDTALRNF